MPSDAAIFAWSSTDPRVARRVNRAEQERTELLARLLEDRGTAARSRRPCYPLRVAQPMPARAIS